MWLKSISLSPITTTMIIIKALFIYITALFMERPDERE